MRCLYLIKQVYLVTNHDLHYQMLWKDQQVLHQSSVLRLLQEHYSPISNVAPFTSVAPIITVAPTVAPFYSIAPFVSYHFGPCDYATRQFYIINNLATDVNTRLFNSIVEI